MADYEKILKELIKWTSTTLREAGGTKAVIGISGGKDSSVAAALMAKALGPEHVYGVLMPNGQQADIEFAEEICTHLGITAIMADISTITAAYHHILEGLMPGRVSLQTSINLPARVRMTMLYAISQSIPFSRVINTSNLSEDWVGYATIYGDMAGAFSPFGRMTTEEVIEIGRLLGVPDVFLVKTPADGLTGKSDEEILGVSYDVINRYIRTNQAPLEDKQLIDSMHAKSRFKFMPLPTFDPGLEIKVGEIRNL